MLITAAPRHTNRLVILLVVLGVHAALLMRAATRDSPDMVSRSDHRPPMLVVPVKPMVRKRPVLSSIPATPVSPSRPRPADVRQRAVSAPTVATTPAPASIETTEATEPVAAPAKTPASAPLQLLESPAVRRQVGKASPWSSLSPAQEAVRSQRSQAGGPDAALTTEIQRAARGDCLKGDYAGSGMGLLSIPALAAAAAKGDCAR